MEPIPMPVIPVGDASNTGLVILPEVDLDALETVSFEVEDEVLRITCIYGSSSGRDETVYPVKITDSNRKIVESMDKIAVMDCEQVDPESLASHPKEKDKLNRMMAQIRSAPDHSPLDLSSLGLSTNGEED